jgi:adenylate cyclase
VFFTDIEGSTSLTQRLGDAKAQELIQLHDTLVRQGLEHYGGRLVKHTGDGMMASFPTVSAALEGAIAIQRAVEERIERQPDLPLRLRMGINAGEPVEEGEDLFGTAVQLARRICDRAQGGEVLVSDVVRQLAAGKGFLFADRGEAALRGFEEPVRVHELRWRAD